MPINYADQLRRSTTPINCVIGRKRGILFVRAWGELSDGDMLAEQRHARADPDFDPSHDQFLDLSEVEQLGIASGGLAEQVAVSRGDPGAKRAFVAPTDVLFGMARMSEIMLDEAPQEIAVFRTASEAREWLGLEESDPGMDAEIDETAGSSWDLVGLHPSAVPVNDYETPEFAVLLALPAHLRDRVCLVPAKFELQVAWQRLIQKQFHPHPSRSDLSRVRALLRPDPARR